MVKQAAAPLLNLERERGCQGDTVLVPCSGPEAMITLNPLGFTQKLSESAFPDRNSKDMYLHR